jgi:hypothetical protein
MERTPQSISGADEQSACRVREVEKYENQRLEVGIRLENSHLLEFAGRFSHRSKN